MVSNLGNPKMAIFFASLLPQFARALATEDEAAFAGLILLGLIFCTMTFAWLAGYALLVASAATIFAGPRSAGPWRA